MTERKERRKRPATKRNGDLEKAIRKPIRVQVIRPAGLAVTDRETIERANAQMVELHEQAVTAARREKLKLLSRRYSLAEDDYEGLALALAIEHEPGFQAIDHQIVELPPGFSGAVRVKDGKLVDKPTGHPVHWPYERLLRLLNAVETEKKKSRLTKDIDVLERLAKQKEWKPPANHRSRSTRGEHEAWVQTLQSRLHDAKQLQRRLDWLHALSAEAEKEVLSKSTNSGNCELGGGREEDPE
jgi:hypothetical protein